MTITIRLCPECTYPDEDPLPWCDCRPDERCSGPCRNRAHTSANCPSTQQWIRDPNCDRCNYDTHSCAGCGEPLPHETEVCDQCQGEIDRGAR